MIDSVEKVDLLTWLQSYIDATYKEYQSRNDYSYESRFNFFLAIASYYQKENLHSDIFKLILDPKTIQIGNPEFLRHFLKAIGFSLNEWGNADSIKKNVTVEREEHRIDVLIKNNKNKEAIIIENKINDAVDQDNQLGRYYKKIVDEDGFIVKKIVYTTLLGGKKPDYKNWDKEFTETGKKIFEESNLFLDFPVSCKGNCWLKFLEECIREFNESNSDEDSILQKIFLEQYKQLLEKLIKGEVMTEKERNIIQTMFDSENKDAVRALFENWQNRGYCAYEYIKDNVNSIEPKKVYGVECLTVGDEKKGSYLFYNGDCLQIGFYREDWWKTRENKQKSDKLIDICKKELKAEEMSDVKYLKNWVYVDIWIDTYDSFEEIKNLYIKGLEMLGEA